MTAPATAQMVMQVQRAQPPAPATAVTVVEYYLRASDRYFLTGRADEKARLDALAALFARTGTSVDACSAGSGSTGSEDYCRFYVSIPVLGESSHFYGTKSTDCPAIIAAKLTSHAFEGYDFPAFTPVPADRCPAHAPLKIYRSFRA